MGVKIGSSGVVGGNFGSKATYFIVGVKIGSNGLIVWG